MELIHSFDADGYYSGSSERPFDPVRGEPATVNEAVATLDPLPEFDAQAQRCRRVNGAWTVEQMPQQEPELEREAAQIEYEAATWERNNPRFFGNSKLDLFTPAEQLAVVTATMTDPVVKLMYDRLLGAAYLTYEDPETERGLSLLLDKGLITRERKNAIVAVMQPN